MGKTFQRVIEALKEEVPGKCGRNEFCRRTKINPNSFDRYVAGISEPNQATLKKLAAYFEKPVWWFRDEGFVHEEFVINPDGSKIKTGEKYLDDNAKTDFSTLVRKLIDSFEVPANPDGSEGYTIKMDFDNGKIVTMEVNGKSIDDMVVKRTSEPSAIISDSSDDEKKSKGGQNKKKLP
jgi:transcriptional regulator with XRE-family HTH domain